MILGVKRLLLVSHRPIDQAGGPAARWRSFSRHLPEHGWDVDVISAGGGDEFAAPEKAERRAKVMETAGKVADPVFRLAGLRPEAMPLSMLWVRLGKRQPSSPVKFTLGLLFIGLAYCLLVPAAWMTANGRISPLWLVGLYFLEVVGEMCLSPVGLSTVTKLAPVKLVGIMMGVWFLAASFGSKLAGYFSGFYVPQSGPLVKLYGSIAVGLLISAGILALLTPRIKKLMGAVN